MLEIDDEVVETLDPIDSTTVDVVFTARELYTVLDALYFDTSNDPYAVLDLVRYLEDRLLDNDLPSSRIEFDSEYVNNHTDNVQYKRIVLNNKGDK
jgi:hypothetical protein